MLLVITTKNDDVLYVENKDFADYTFQANSTSSNEFELGGAIPCSFDFSIFDHNFKQYQLYGATIEAYTGNEVNINHKLGTFKINSIDIQQDLIILESDDALSDTDVKWKGRSFPCTMWEILTNVCLQCGISLNLTQEELPNANIQITTEGDFKNVKCRDILRWIAEANGMFCMINNRNQLVFKKYNFDNIIQIAQSDIDTLLLEQTNTIRKGINVNGKIFGDTQYPIKVMDNAILNNMTAANLTIACNNIIPNIMDIDYYAGSFNVWNEDYNLQIGDVVEVIDDDGDSFLVTIHAITMDNEDEFFEIESYGDSIEDKNENREENEPYDDGSDSRGGNSGDNAWGVAKNHQAIDAKQGRFVIVEKTVFNVDYFTKVNLELSINFTYTANKFINFDIYSNDKFIRRVPVMGTGQLYHITESFLADIDYTPSQCTFSVIVDINDGEELIINPFEAILTLKALNGQIEDQTATDQYFIERMKQIPTSLANQKRFNIGYIRDELTVPDPYAPQYAILVWEWPLITEQAQRDNGWQNAITAKYYVYTTDGHGELQISGYSNPDNYHVDSIFWPLEYHLEEGYGGHMPPLQVRDEIYEFSRNVTEVKFIGDFTKGCRRIDNELLNKTWRLPYGGLDPSKAIAKFENLEIVDYAYMDPMAAVCGCQNLTSLEEVRLGNCKLIGSQAFSGCTNLNNINLSNVEYISVEYLYNGRLQGDAGAFYRCSSLTNLDLSHCKYIGDTSFYQCSELLDVNLPIPLPIGTATPEFPIIDRATMDASFYGCVKMGGNIVLTPWGSEHVAARAFYNTMIDNVVLQPGCRGLAEDMVHGILYKPTIYICEDDKLILNALGQIDSNYINRGYTVIYYEAANYDALIANLSQRGY